MRIPKYLLPEKGLTLDLARPLGRGVDLEGAGLDSGIGALTAHDGTRDWRSARITSGGSIFVAGVCTIILGFTLVKAALDRGFWLLFEGDATVDLAIKAAGILFAFAFGLLAIGATHILRGLATRGGRHDQ